jgi:hypothetical protein
VDPQTDSLNKAYKRHRQLHRQYYRFLTSNLRLNEWLVAIAPKRVAQISIDYYLHTELDLREGHHAGVLSQTG